MGGRCVPFRATDPAPRVLVTGGAGFIGGHLVAALRQRAERDGTPITLKVIDNLWRGRAENLRSTMGAPFDLERDLCVADLTDYAAAERLTRHATDIYHLADIVAGIDFVFPNQAFIFEKNLRINMNTVRAARSNRVPALVYTATACSLPKQLQNNYSMVSISEQHLYPANPESSYGWSKLMGEYQLRREQAAAMAAGERFDVGIVRLQHVYGPRCAYRNGSQALPALIRKAVLYPREGFSVMGSGRQYRDFLYVDDAVEAILAVRDRAMNRGTVQVGTGEAVTLRRAAQQVAAVARRELGKRLVPSFDPSWAEGDKGRVAELSAARAIGWRAKVPFDEGLRRTFRWIMSDMGIPARASAGADGPVDRRVRQMVRVAKQQYPKSAPEVERLTGLLRDGEVAGAGGRGGGDGGGGNGAAANEMSVGRAAPVPAAVLEGAVRALRQAQQEQPSVGWLVDRAECAMTVGGLPMLNASLLYESSHMSAKRVIDAALGKLLMRFAAAVARPSPTSRAVSTWRWTSVPSTIDKWAKYLRCGEQVDAWRCMFGAKQTSRAECRGEAGTQTTGAQAHSVRPLHQMLAAARMIVLQGHRASPLLAPGPLPPPVPFDGRSINVSVHVRGGDACDVIEHRPLNASLAWGRYEIVGNTMRGHCPHPSVHLAYVKALLGRLEGEGIRVDALLLATDSEDASALFEDAFRSSRTRLVSRAFDRRATANRKWKLTQKAESQWIEFRKFDGAEGAAVTVSALEDLRMLAQGHLIVGTMCSNMAALGWNLMVAHHGWMTPYVSLDACLPQLEKPEEVPRDRIHLPYGGSHYREARRQVTPAAAHGGKRGAEARGRLVINGVGGRSTGG